MTVKRIYVSNMKEEEIFEHLKAGRVVERDDDDGKYKLVNGLICRYEDDTITDIGYTLDLEDAALYIDIDEPFKISGPGMYKTRDGSKAFVSAICEGPGVHYPAYGIIEGSCVRESWTLKGRAVTDHETSEDLVEKL